MPDDGRPDEFPPPPPAAAPELAPGWPPPPAPPGVWGPARPTNKTAVVSLVFGCAQFVLCGIGAIVAIVTGHVARGQIRRSEGAEGGEGLATAGLALGYVGLGLTVLAGAGITLLLVFVDDIERSRLRDEARDYVQYAEREAGFRDSELRDPEVLYRALLVLRSQDDDYGKIELATGVPIESADMSDWERARWRIELSSDSIGDPYVCAVVPEEVGSEVRVTNGRCPP